MFEIFQFQEKEYFIQENHTKADSTSVVRSVLYKTSVRVLLFVGFFSLLYLVFSLSPDGRKPITLRLEQKQTLL